MLGRFPPLIVADRGVLVEVLRLWESHWCDWVPDRMMKKASHSPERRSAAAGMEGGMGRGGVDGTGMV